MAAQSINEILDVPTQDDALNLVVLPELRSRKVRVTDWIVGGVYRAMSFVVALLYVEVRKIVAAMAAAGFEDYVFGFAEAPFGIDVTGWAPFLAKQRYNTNQILATSTRRTIRLTNTSGASYGPLLAGKITILFPSSGNRYILDETITIPDSGTNGGIVDATFRSEFAVDVDHAYNDAPALPAGSILLVTSNFPGVSATNPSPTYSPVSQVGSGIGLLTLTGSPSTEHTVIVKILTTGIAGVASWTTQVDSASPVPRGTASSATNLGGFGIDVALNDNGGSPSFLAGAVYYFQSIPGDITEVGRVIETPPELGSRCRALWPSLAFVKDAFGNAIWMSPTMSAYEALARGASDQVKNCLVQTDGTVNNKVNILVAGQSGPLRPDALAAVSAVLTSRTMLTDFPEVQTTTQGPITLGGLTITVKSALATSAKAAMNSALQLYFGGGDPGSLLAINGLVDWGYLMEIIRGIPGVTHVTPAALTIRGAVTDFQLPVVPGAFEQASWAEDVASVFTWVTV